MYIIFLHKKDVDQTTFSLFFQSECHDYINIYLHCYSLTDYFSFDNAEIISFDHLYVKGTEPLNIVFAGQINAGIW